MSEEQPTKCPDCGQMSCYDYNGMQVCKDCSQREADLQYEWDTSILKMREYMKGIRFIAKTEEDQKNADVMNQLVPAIVDQITDEEILTALKQQESNKNE